MTLYHLLLYKSLPITLQPVYVPRDYFWLNDVSMCNICIRVTGRKTRKVKERGLVSLKSKERMSATTSL